MKPSDSWIESLTDATLDATLRDVPVPAGLPERMRPEAVFDDRTVDRILGQVPVPLGLAARLLRNHVAAQVPANGRPAPGSGRRLPPWLRAVVRDGLAVAIVLGMAATMFLAGLRVAEWAQVAQWERGPVRMRPLPTRAERSIAEGGERPVPRLGGDDLLAVDRPEQRAADPVGARPTAPHVAAPAPMPVRPPALRAAPVPPLAEESPSAAAAHFPGMWIVPGGDSGDAAARRLVPGMRGFDLEFEMSHGEPPFVDPSIAPGLAVDRPPLVVATDSFDRVWPLPAGRRRRSELDALRVEHVLAGLSARGPAGGSAGMTVALSAVRSLRPGRPTYLVEVRVDVPFATAAADAAVAPVDATLVLDHSAAPGAVPLWLAACRGLAATAARMAPADRLTVVVAEPRPRVVAVRAEADGIRRLAAELEAELPFGIADLDSAVSLAREVMAREGSPERLVVVAHAERAEHCVGAGREAINRWREAVSRDDASGTAPRCLLIGGVPDGTSAAVAGMPGWTLSDPTMLRRRLADTLAARPAAVLENAVVEVTFDPARISAYRLVGHRQSVPESLSAFGRQPSGESGVTIHAGEAVRAVYEVVPRQPPRDRLDGISATFTCRDPAGNARAVTARAATLDPVDGAAPSAASCELLLAVAVGEFPGRSVHAVPKPAVLDGVRELAAAWERRGDMTALGGRLLLVFDELSAGRGPSGKR